MWRKRFGFTLQQSSTGRRWQWKIVVGNQQVGTGQFQSHFRCGSDATESFSAGAGRCLLFPDSDRFADNLRMTRRATSDELAPQRLKGASGFVGWIIAPRERPDRPRQMSPERPIYL